MKKLVFTALAVVAFSGAGMVKTNPIKTIKKVKVTNAVKKETPRCYYGWIAVWKACGIEAADAWGAANGC